MNEADMNEVYINLVNACGRGDLETVQEIVKTHSIDIHRDNEMIFQWTVCHMHIPILEFLLDSFDIDLYTDNNQVFKLVCYDDGYRSYWRECVNRDSTIPYILDFDYYEVDDEETEEEIITPDSREDVLKFLFRASGFNLGLLDEDFVQPHDREMLRTYYEKSYPKKSARKI